MIYIREDIKSAFNQVFPHKEITQDDIELITNTRFDDQWEDFIHNQCVPLFSEGIAHLLSLLRFLEKKAISKDYFPGLIVLCYRYGI